LGILLYYLERKDAVTAKHNSAVRGASEGRSEHAGTRTDRIAAAHAWVLEHHAETFAKLAK